MFYISDAIGMWEHSFGFVDDEVVSFFYQDGDFDIWSLCEDDGGEISFQIINKNLIPIFEFERFFNRFIIY